MGWTYLFSALHRFIQKLKVCLDDRQTESNNKYLAIAVSRLRLPISFCTEISSVVDRCGKFRTEFGNDHRHVFIIVFYLSIASTRTFSYQKFKINSPIRLFASYRIRIPKQNLEQKNKNNVKFAILL